jgi:hypothetical protein
MDGEGKFHIFIMNKKESLIFRPGINVKIILIFKHKREVKKCSM